MSLVVEAVAEFGGELAGVVEVEAAEGEAVVEQDAAVGEVGGGDGGGEVFAEGLAEERSKRGVLRAGRRWGRGWRGRGCRCEAGAVADVGGGGESARAGWR